MRQDDATRQTNRIRLDAWRREVLAASTPPPPFDYLPLWRDIHVGALDLEAGRIDADAYRAIVAGVIARLPAKGCGCQTHATQRVEATPVDVADPFGWSVAFHSDVSVSIGKAVVSVGDARARWGNQISGSPSSSTTVNPVGTERDASSAT